MATKAELYERAGELGIASRDKMTKTQLADAIMEAEAKGNPMEEPTPEQTVDARGKDVDALLEDAVSEDKKAAKAAEREIEARAEAEKAKAKAESLKRRIPQQYVITTRCLISSNGSLTELAEGSIVSAVTHNLAQIRKAGGEFEACNGTKLVRDQFGRLQTIPVK